MNKQDFLHHIFKYPRQFFALSLILLSYSFVSANNVRVSNVTLTGKDNPTQTTKIKFDLYWENSWRTSGGTNNWDAIWVFAKYRTCQGGSPLGAWTHCFIGSNAGDHTPPAGYTMDPTSDSMGVFFHRSAVGSGTVNATDVEMLWDYGANGLSDEDEIEIEVHGIEMVYIPQGSFHLGDGSNASQSGIFYTYPTNTSTYQITSEAAINVGATNGYLYHQTSGVAFSGGDLLGPIPAAFPKGYDAFYIMKYEVSQGQYVDFLNSLTNSTQADNNKPISNGDRQTITGSWPNFTESAPGRACNNIGWNEAKAYSDWAALRPLTEFEWEKAARGPVTPQPNEYPWGNNLITTTSYTLVNDGTDSARTTTLNDNVGNANIQVSGSGTTDGPWRCGIFANDTTTRMEAGASYYGVMEMAGNLWEFIVSYGSPERRAFTGSHGDGELDTSTGDATNSDWPDDSYSGGGRRGGSYYAFTQYCKISNREYAVYNGPAGRDMGIRSARTAP